jgi:undecaprenyl-diphosphatase
MSSAAQADRRNELDPTVATRSASGWRAWLAELGHYEPQRLAESGAILVAGFGAAAVLLYAFAWLATQVLDQDTRALDLATLSVLQGFSSPGLTLVAEAISMMGSQVVLVLGLALLGAFVWQRRWGAAVTLVLVTAGAQVLNDILKESFHRTRPAAVVGFISAQDFSFPSGHAMVAAAFYLYVAYLTWRLVHGWWRGLLVGGLLVLIVLIGLARLYLEAHYLSDVLAGYLAGGLWTDAVVLSAHMLRLRSFPARAGPGSLSSRRSGRPGPP